jgi:hypothetical protein
MLNIPSDPKLQKDLAEEHQREILEDVEAERLAHDELPDKDTENPSEDYQPVTDDSDELLHTHRKNRHIHDDK